MKFNFWEKSAPQKSEWQLEKERQADQAREELNSIRLDVDEITGEMSPNKVVELNSKVANLLSKLPQEEIGFESLSPGEEALPVPKTIDTEEMFDFLSHQPPRVLGYLLAGIEQAMHAPGIGEKFREYDRAHWREVFQREIDKGITPFGDLRDVMKDIHLKQGIDLENPTEGDVNAYFQNRQYTSGSIGTELNRRREEGFADIGKAAREAMSIVYSFLMRKVLSPQDPEKDWYQEEEKQARLLEIKDKLIDLIQNHPTDGEN